MSNPLNPQLYNALSRRCGDVKIANAGEPFIPAERSGSFVGQRPFPKPIQAGEYYRVNCPCCSDQRQRLYVNHMFAVRTDDGDDHLYLCICHNEGCINTLQKQLRLHNKIYPFRYGRCQTPDQITSSPTQVAHPVANQQEPVQLPVLIPLSEPAAIGAAQYLSGRGFDCQEVSTHWNVGYCSSSPESSPRIHDRLVIPIYAYRQNLLTQVPEVYLAGWQAREVNPGHPSSCKYLSMKGLRKNQLLYGIPQAIATTGPLIIVEGPTDVWRLGTKAVATFGKTISSHQIALLTQYFYNRPIIVIFDQDASAESERAASQIRSEWRKYGIRTPVTTLSPPEGYKDIGDCPRDYIWQYIRYYAAGILASINPGNALQPEGTSNFIPAGSETINHSTAAGMVNGWEVEL